MKKTILLTLLLGACLTGWSQVSGYLVTNENDTIQGTIKVKKDEKSYYQKIIFTPKGSRKPVKYKGTDINGFRKYKDQFISKKLVNGGGGFLRIIETGTVNLYEGLEYSSFNAGAAGQVNSVSRCFFWKKGEQFSKVNPKNKQQLLTFLSDNGPLKAEIEGSTRKELDVQALVKKYNSAD